MPKCNCKLKSGEPCPYNAKSGSLYCGKHKLCNKNQSPKRASPKRASSKRNSPCPSGKELNPRTNRCVAKCSPHQIRNEKGRCVSPKRNQPQHISSGKKMYPICLRFYVVINESSEIANPSTLTEEAKALFRDAIENKFVQRLEDVSRIRITDIQLTFTNDSIILMKGLIPIPSNDKRLLYGATLSSWINAIDEKGVWQMGFGPNRDDSVISNGKEYNLFSVNQCK